MSYSSISLFNQTSLMNNSASKISITTEKNLSISANFSNKNEDNGKEVNIKRASTVQSGSKLKSKEESKPDYEVYNFQDSGIGVSWQLGDSSTTSGNALIGGLSVCPPNLTIPRTLTDQKGVKKPVEVIAEYAFNFCGNKNNGNTKAIYVTKQVKIIKNRGLGNMHDVETFEIEPGSELGTIDSYGIEAIGYNVGKNVSKRTTLVLPSTLAIVPSHGIYKCNLFMTIVYCGTNPLTASCILEESVSVKVGVNVTTQYPASTIFGRSPVRESQGQVDKLCSAMEVRPNRLNMDENCGHSASHKETLSVLVIASALLSGSDESERDSKMPNYFEEHEEVVLIRRRRRILKVRQQRRSTVVSERVRNK